MALLVQKFGGTSLANIDKINHAADIVMKAREAGYDIVVVVSAMSGETDRLINLAHEMSPSPSPREYAALVATGEQVTMALMSMALEKRGLAAISFSGSQAGILTCSQFKKARIQSINSEKILNEIKQNKVVVVAGFQGVDPAGNITTLGRGGSDTSAVALAAACGAEECQIFTDVDGVYTTDPNVDSSARRLSQITFEEMLELSSLGSKVLQIRSVEFAGKYNVPLRVLSSAKPSKGTLITYNQKPSMESPLVSGIAFSRYEAKVTLVSATHSVRSLPEILNEISVLGVNIDMLIQTLTPKHQGQVMFTIHRDEYKQTLMHFQQSQDRLNLVEVTGIDHLAKLSIVGAGLKSHPEVASTLFNTLSAQNIAVQLMSMSEIKLSVVIDAAKLDEGVKALHKAFRLDQEVVASESSLAIDSSYAEDTSVIYSEN